MKKRPLSNPLGDIRAEADHSMLDRAFFETPDYLSLLDSDDKVVVVGRRGTGKSALTFRLANQWSSVKGNGVLVVAPEEHETLALAPMIARTGSHFLAIRAATRIIWRYGLLMEAAQILSTRYKAKDVIASGATLLAHLHLWGKADVAFFDKLRVLLRRHLTPDLAHADVMSTLADALQLSKIEREIRPALQHVQSIKILIDRLDEGFEPNESGVAFIDGVISAAVDVATAFKGLIRPLVFLRDNIFRAVAAYDQDFTRNIEGQTLRLHWDVDTLFYVVCNRLRAAFGREQENNKRLWNSFTAHDLQGDDGFRQCLRFTLYRPRDILILLNSAFEHSSKRDASPAVVTIGLADIEASAKTISMNRLDDIKKEYKQIFPSIDYLVNAFSGANPEMTVDEASSTLEAVIEKPPQFAQSQMELAIIDRPEDLVRALYGVGFFGVFDKKSSSYVFRHDGRQQEIELTSAERLSVHPCYWISLNMTRRTIEPESAVDINDEYEMKVVSVTPTIRTARLGRAIAELDKIPLGEAGSSAFEEWCLRALKICLAGKLENLDLHPNGQAVSRRDIVGTNLGEPYFWRRVLEDYRARQVIFEIKNYEVLTLDDYRQVLSYMTGTYGEICFFVARSDSVNLERDRELNWCRSVYNEHRKLVVKLTGKFLSDLLSKLRSPQKHDAPDQAFMKLIDTYVRLYLGQASRGAPARRRAA